MEAKLSNGYGKIKVESCFSQGTCKPLDCHVSDNVCGLPSLFQRLNTNGCGTKQKEPCEPTSPINSHRCPDVRCERARVIFELQNAILS